MDGSFMPGDDAAIHPGELGILAHIYGALSGPNEKS
jgi:hypothetical protein